MQATCVGSSSARVHTHLADLELADNRIWNGSRKALLLGKKAGRDFRPFSWPLRQVLGFDVAPRRPLRPPLCRLLRPLLRPLLHRPSHAVAFSHLVTTTAHGPRQ